jgi:hypothetical protein
MTLVLWVAAGLGVMAVIAFGIVPFVTRPSALESSGETQAVSAGGVLSFLLIAGLLFAANPDRMTEVRSRAVEAAVLTALSAVVWLPVYLVAVKARVRRGRRE